MVSDWEEGVDEGESTEERALGEAMAREGVEVKAGDLAKTSIRAWEPTCCA